jgi:hypothetical protein
MSVHIGHLIKARLKKNGMSVSEFARRLNTSRGNIHSMFNRASIQTNTLGEISKILNYDFFSHYTPVSTEVESLKKQIAELRITLDQILKAQKNE